jgi:hypothetical protein
MVATVYISCLEPKTTTELVQFIYNPDSVAQINSTPVSKARASLENAHYLVRQGVMLRNTRFRAAPLPILEYIRTVIARGSQLKFDDPVFAALEKVIDSKWFRGFFSESFLRDPPRYTIYNNVHIECKESDSKDSDSNGKLTISDAMRLATGILADIGIFGIALKQLDESGDAFHSLYVKTIVSAPDFDDLIHQHQNAIPEDLAKLLFNEIGRYRTDRWGIPSDTGNTLVPEELLHHMSWIPGILPADLCELMARSSDRPPLTLLTTLQSVIVPDILSKKINRINP